jgi:ribonucleoside-diphosphate reductase alpha chain
MTELYAAAWRMGVKTTYYLHMMPRHTAEQSTVKVNKAESSTPAGGPVRRGFGAARAAVADAPAVVPDEITELEMVDGEACPIDPQERLNCDSCQ